MAERFRISKEANNLKESMRSRGLKAVIFDLDGTLVEDSIFTQKILEYGEAVCSDCPDLEADKFAADLWAANIEAFATHGVRRNRWPAVAEILALQYEHHNLGGTLLQHIGIFEEIYTTMPVFKPGARQTLAAIREVDIVQGLVTHGNFAWKAFQINSLRLDSIFGERIVIIPEDVYKTPEEWRGALNKLGLHPQRVVVVGDNLPGDILATHEIGVRTHVWIRQEHAWDPYMQGEIPEGVVQITDIGLLIPSLNRLLGAD